MTPAMFALSFAVAVVFYVISTIYNMYCVYKGMKAFTEAFNTVEVKATIIEEEIK